MGALAQPVRMWRRPRSQAWSLRPSLGAQPLEASALMGCCTEVRGGWGAVACLVLPQDPFDVLHEPSLLSWASCSAPSPLLLKPQCRLEQSTSSLASAQLSAPQVPFQGATIQVCPREHQDGAGQMPFPEHLLRRPATRWSSSVKRGRAESPGAPRAAPARTGASLANALSGPPRRSQQDRMSGVSMTCSTLPAHARGAPGRPGSPGGR